MGVGAAVVRACFALLVDQKFMEMRFGRLHHPPPPVVIVALMLKQAWIWRPKRVVRVAGGGVAIGVMVGLRRPRG
jgi:hypothetical protein